MTQEKTYAEVRWTPGDVQTLRPHWSLQRCEEALVNNQNRIRDRLVELGWDVIDTLISMDEQAEVDPNLPKIMARFVPQATIGDTIIDIDGAREFDVTNEMLTRTIGDIQSMQDDQLESDELADLVEFQHSGPFRVEVEEAIKAFFGVEDLNDIEDEAVERERNLRNVRNECKLIVVYNPPHPHSISDIDKQIEQHLDAEFSNSGTALMGAMQRDLEFFFDTREEAEAALELLPPLEELLRLGIEGRVVLA